MAKAVLLTMAKILAAFAVGFFLMLGLLNVLLWMFGKTAALVIGWLIILIAWVVVIAFMLVADRA